jgi:type VI protein secretion system component Hcp
MRLDAFLTLTSDSVETSGETTDGLFASTDIDPKPIEILWFQQIATRGRYENRGTGMNQQGVASSRMQLSFMSVIKPLDQTSPKLLQAVGEPAADNNGFVYSEAKIQAYYYWGNSSDIDYSGAATTLRKPYLEITMSNVNIMRLQLVADPRVISIAGGAAEVYYQLPDDLAAMGPLEMLDLSYTSSAWSYLGERNATSPVNTSGDIPPAPA